MGGYAGLLGYASVFSEVSLLGGRLVRLLAGLLSLVVLGGMVGVVGPVAAGEIIVPDSDGGWGLVDAGDGFSDIAEAGGHRANVETLGLPPVSWRLALSLDPPMGLVVGGGLMR